MRFLYSYTAGRGGRIGFENGQRPADPVRQVYRIAFMNRLNPATDRVSMLHVRMPRRPAAGAARVRVVYLDVEAKLHAAAQPRLHYSFARHLSSRFRRTFRDTFRASDLDRGADYPVSLTRGRLPPLRLSRTRPIGIGRT